MGSDGGQLVAPNKSHCIHSFDQSIHRSLCVLLTMLLLFVVVGQRIHNHHHHHDDRTVAT